MQEAIPYKTFTPPLNTSTTKLFSLSTPSSSRRDLRCRDDDDEEQASDTTTTRCYPIENDRLKHHVTKMVSENALIVFGIRGCCMCHVVKKLLLGHGVNPRVFDFDEDDEAGVVRELSRIIDGDDDNCGTVGTIQFPVVFVGGKLFGGLDKVMSSHISGELVPILKNAGALWL